MASSGGGGQQGQSDNTYYVLWVLALIFGIGAVIWLFFDVYLKTFFLATKRYELTLVYYALEWIPTSFPFIGETLARVVGEVKGSLDLVSQLTVANLSLDVAEILSETTGNYLRWPISLYFIFVSIVIYKTSVQIRLKKKFNMKTLAEQERVNWPQIDIATRFDILNEDLDSGPWAMNMSPVQFCRKYKLITAEVNTDIPVGIPRSQVPEFKITLNRTRVERAFAAQLGRPWQGVEAMPPHRRALLAMFVARGGRDSKASSALGAQLARSAGLGKLDCRGADDLWRKYVKNKRVEEMFARHGYEYTVFISILLYAREDGVLASADFLWLKPIDRRLWYVLNSIGRQTPSVEAGGVFSHWNYEMVLRKPLSVPMVINAVNALDQALSEVFYMPDEKEREEIFKKHEAQTSEG